MKNNQSKIFCLGLSKTGTTSLAAALAMLGYQTKDNLGVTTYTAGDLIASVDLSIIDNNDAFTDTPIPSFYKELDLMYPNSKFILTVRELKSWLSSCKKQFNQRATEKRSDVINDLFEDIYETHFFEEEKFTVGYRCFVDEAINYFKNRPEDLLIIDISAGEGWEKLCTFLGKTIPEEAFPKANVTQVEWINIEDLVALAKDTGYEVMKEHAKIVKLDLATKNSGIMSWMSRMMYGNKSSILDKSIDVSYQSIVNGLHKLTPSIPVLSIKNNNITYLERKLWNHVWLIGPLNGSNNFINNKGNFSLSFSLIQNGKPIYGVIFDLKNDCVYYAKGGSGSYIKQRDKQPINLEKFNQTDDINTGIVVNNQLRNLELLNSDLKKIYPNLQLDNTNYLLDSELAFCKMAKGEVDILFIAESTMEWETAAAQIILNELGKTLYDYETKNELCYNKANLKNGDNLIGQNKKRSFS